MNSPAGTHTWTASSNSEKRRPGVSVARGAAVAIAVEGAWGVALGDSVGVVVGVAGNVVIDETNVAVGSDD